LPHAIDYEFSLCWGQDSVETWLEACRSKRFAIEYRGPRPTNGFCVDALRARESQVTVGHARPHRTCTVPINRPLFHPQSLIRTDNECARLGDAVFGDRRADAQVEGRTRN